VKSPSFIGLHELFDNVDDAAQSYVDMIAEGTVRAAAACSAPISPHEEIASSAYSPYTAGKAAVSPK
jgi:DNA-binding ferritin-like protein